jgi:hypothetical protein
MRQGQQRHAEQEQAEDDFARQLERAESRGNIGGPHAAELHGESACRRPDVPSLARRDVVGLFSARLEPNHL